jgi:hypothetical protein
MTELLQRDNESRRPRIRAALKVIVFVSAFVVLLLASAGRLRTSEGDWAIFTLGLLYALHLARDVRRGRTQVPSRVNLPRYDYVRSADPIGFWILIALQGVFAAAAVLAASADLLGFWNLWR